MSPHKHEDVPDVNKAWWKEGAVYQIYPASFKDSNGTGVGDIKGIISKIDYLSKLGVDIVWLSPIFESPQVDMGYDISDYYKINPAYGSIDDVDALKDELHERGLKLVLDLVVNHTSDRHPWFTSSRSSKDSPHRDWYIWKDPRYDKNGNRLPPNNWQSHFQGSAWEYDDASGQYYLHLFCKEQPDLNWENPDVRSAVHENVRFWLNRGIDGFRLDVINFISKHPDFPHSDESVLAGHEFYAAGPRLHEYLKELGSILREYDAFSVGEMPCVHDPKEIIKSVSRGRHELSMIFHFEMMDLDHGPQGKFSAGTWTLADLKRVTNKWQQFMIQNNGWNAMYLENHDQPRSVSRFANDSVEFRVDSAKMLAAFLGLLSGTPFIYQGQELGMHNIPQDWSMDEYKDVDCLRHWRLHTGDTADDSEKQASLKDEYQKKSRDNARTPMQWDNTKNAGFSSSDHPWMRVNPNFETINAASELADENSTFNFWRDVLRLRKSYPDIFVYGDFSLVDENNANIFAYARGATSGEKVVVMCNFSTHRIPWRGVGAGNVDDVLLSSKHRHRDHFQGTQIDLDPYEAAAVLLHAPATTTTEGSHSTTTE